MKEPLLEEAEQEEAEEIVKDLPKVWDEFLALLEFLAVDETVMRQRARAAGIGAFAKPPL